MRARRLFDRARRVVAVGAAGLTAAWAVGQAARDDTYLTGLCFYVPSAVVAAGLTLVVGLYAADRRRVALAALAAAAPVLAVVGRVENRLDRAPADRPGDYRLVHWNTGGRPARPGVVEYLLAERADVYVLTDTPGPAHTEHFRARLGPAYAAATFANLAVVGRGTVRPGDRLVDRAGFVVRAVAWTPPAGRPVALVVADLPSSVFVARDPLLRELTAVVEARRPDLVVGDFNAPRRSRALAALPAGYAHAYETAGGGYGATWPVPVPVYALDHCLHGPRVAARAYRLGGRGGDSDHLYQAFDFARDGE